MSDHLPADQGVRRNVWLEEYKTCSCSFVSKTKAELPGYCAKHGHDKKRRVRLPMSMKPEDYGYAG